MKISAVCLTVFSLLVSISPTAFAQSEPQFANDLERQKYLTIDTVVVNEIDPISPARLKQIIAGLKKLNTPNTDKALRRWGLKASGSVELSTGDVVADSVIDVLTDPTSVQTWLTIGQKVWEMIAANKPVVNVSSNSVSVVPKDQPNWSELENWKGPMTKTYTMEFKNLYGMSVVTHTYTIAYNYDGQYQGKGHYLANATIIPSQIDVVWGYTLNSKVEIGQTVNTASGADPIPGVPVQLDWSVDTIFKHSQGAETYFIKGNGEAKAINSLR